MFSKTNYFFQNTKTKKIKKKLKKKKQFHKKK